MRNQRVLLLVLSILCLAACSKSREQIQAEYDSKAGERAEAERRAQAGRQAQAEAAKLEADRIAGEAAKRDAVAKAKEDDQQIESMKTMVVSRLKDPASAQFRNLRMDRTNSAFCGDFNAKNAFGGYVGHPPDYGLRGAGRDSGRCPVGADAR